MPGECATALCAPQADAERLRAALASAEARADEAEGALAGAQAEVEIATRDLQARALRADTGAPALLPIHVRAAARSTCHDAAHAVGSVEAVWLLRAVAELRGPHVRSAKVHAAARGTAIDARDALLI
jgi:hypothetical protein